MFDSSVARGEPAEFPVNGVIAGWIEALTLMPVGSKWELTIPHNGLRRAWCWRIHPAIQHHGI